MRDATVMWGQDVIDGTRIPKWRVAQLIRQGLGIEGVKRSYPTLTNDQIIEAYCSEERRLNR